MAGSRLFGGKFPMKRSRPQVCRTVFKPLSPITSWAEVNAWRTSELMIMASGRSVIGSPHGLRLGGDIIDINGILLTCGDKSQALVQTQRDNIIALGIHTQLVDTVPHQAGKHVLHQGATHALSL